MTKRNELEITIWDDEGNIVRHEYIKCDLASDVEIADMITMIEKGTPAHLAAFLAKQEQS